MQSVVVRSAGSPVFLGAGVAGVENRRIEGGLGVFAWVVAGEFERSVEGSQASFEGGKSIGPDCMDLASHLQDAPGSGEPTKGSLVPKRAYHPRSQNKTRN